MFLSSFFHFLFILPNIICFNFVIEGVYFPCHDLIFNWTWRYLYHDLLERTYAGPPCSLQYFELFCTITPCMLYILLIIHVWHILLFQPYILSYYSNCCSTILLRYPTLTQWPVICGLWRPFFSRWSSSFCTNISVDFQQAIPWNNVHFEVL